jgi:hypothetical protein
MGKERKKCFPNSLKRSSEYKIARDGWCVVKIFRKLKTEEIQLQRNNAKKKKKKKSASELKDPYSETILEK